MNLRFDNRLRDAAVNVRRKQKTYDGFERLPESFTSEDVMRCFNMASDGSARMKISRFLQDHLIEKIEEPKGKASSKAKYRKTGVIMY